jgi:hypothetical protein
LRKEIKQNFKVIPIEASGKKSQIPAGFIRVYIWVNESSSDEFASLWSFKV